MRIILKSSINLKFLKKGGKIKKLHEKKLLGAISFCVNNSIAVDWIRISWSNKVYFFDNYISSNCFICNIIAKIAKVICE